MRPQSKRSIRAGLVLPLLAGCTFEAGTYDEPQGTESENLYYTPSAVWSDPSISVCWLSSANSTERGWVRAAVEAAVESISDADFTGWGTCTGSGAEVAVQVGEDEWPRSVVGTRSPSMTPNLFLNFFNTSAHDIDGDGISGDFSGCYGSSPSTGLTGKTWSTSRRMCIESIAVHEFFHSLSIRHEQGRDDTPSWCTAGSRVPGQTNYGYWDPLSMSNYCNPLWNGEGFLSTLDVSGLRSLYGPNGNDFIWFSFGNASRWNSNINQIAFDVRHKDVQNTYDTTTGDLDGDGRDDILWYRAGADSDTIYWGRADGEFDHTSPTVNGTYQIAAGNFDGDQYDDVLLYGNGGNTYIWWGQSARTPNSIALSVSLTGATPLVGDFDGDTRADIFWYRPGSANDPVWYGRADRSFDQTSNYNVSNTYVPRVGDFDGDGKYDIFWYGPGSASDSTWYGNASRTFTSSAALGVSGTYDLAVGKFDADNRSDILWNMSGVTDKIWRFTGRDAFDTTFISYDGTGRPIVGDFNGDSRSDVFWYQPG